MSKSIYCLRNIITGAIYIGQTRQKLRIRLKKHWQATGECPHLSRAIHKYGRRSFTVEVLFCGEVSNAQLDQMEQHCIALLRGMKSKLYNIAAGGQGTSGLKHTAATRDRLRRRHSKEIHQYELCGAYVGTWPSSTAAGTTLGISHRNIRTCSVGQRGEAGGFRWSRTKHECLAPIRGHYKKVHMYTKDGTYVRSFDCLKDCADVARIADVAGCCSGRRKSAGGFMWSWDLYDTMPAYFRKVRKDKKHVKN